MKGKPMKHKILRILAPCDGSPESEEAFAAMMPIVRADHPEVTVLYVFENPEASYDPPARLAKSCHALRASGVDARLLTRDGKPAEEIVRLAKAQNMDLIVLSTHGRSGIARAVLGSVVEEVIRHAETPVLVTRPGAAIGDWKRMLVALDGSTRGEEILQDVIPLAWRLRASVELVRSALPPITMSGLGDVGGVQIVEDPMPYLKQMKAVLAEEGVDAEVTALQGRAASSILSRAKENGASLLCLTTHGRTGFERILMGSVAEEVVRHAPCPVLIRRSVRFDGLAHEKPQAKAPAERN
jgi:nucleotide-binding universal stress UspA family protein